MVLSKQELIDSLRNEVRILVHLCGKIQPEALDYRPTAKQRSTIELLRYLTIMGPILVESIEAGSFLMDKWTAAEAHSKTLAFPEVVAALEAESALYAEALAGVSDEELTQPITLFGPPMSRARQIVDMVIAGHAAYRTQLFCYLKACGREELSTMNLWAGVDAPAEG
jgi:hypothetical protein